MKALFLTLWILVGAVPAFASERGHHVDGYNGLKPAPAPLIGLGIPVALAVGGVLLGGKFLRRKR